MPWKIGARESMVGTAATDAPVGALTTDVAALRTADTRSSAVGKRWSSPTPFEHSSALARIREGMSPLCWRKSAHT